MPNYDNKNKGALWWKKDKNQKNYQTGTININGTDVYISIFKNQFKKENKHPDFTVMVSFPKKQGFQQQQPQQQQSNIEFQDFDQNTLGDDEVPF